ncbi:hypothetical protein LSAT2_007802, partial [Lamellibrachia satsuma]
MAATLRSSRLVVLTFPVPRGQPGDRIGGLGQADAIDSTKHSVHGTKPSTPTARLALSHNSSTITLDVLTAGYYRINTRPCTDRQNVDSGSHDCVHLPRGRRPPSPATVTRISPSYPVLSDHGAM